MRSFVCQCGSRVFFLNSHCVNCNRPLGYFPRLGQMGALEPAGQYVWTSPGTTPAGSLYRKCNNYAVEDVCNWMVEDTDPDPFCWSCRLNQVIPDLTRPRHRYYWYKIESAKRYMLYGLYQLRLPVISKQHNAEHGLAFTFLADADSAAEFNDPIHGQEAVLTGHRSGLITINLAEADEVVRARMREQMQERYRTLLGHFRHEIGHYYWDRLIREQPARLDAYRELFGDERRDYQGAMELHYQKGPPAGWEQHYISSYASMHPWEDWAECWAHYMHMIDTLETAHEFGLVPPNTENSNGSGQDMSFNPAHEDFQHMLGRWVQLAVAMNALSRSMGLPDVYPFVLPRIAQRKLAFIHQLIAGLNNGT